MRYHHPTRSFTIPRGALDSAADSLIYAMRHIRQQAGLPLIAYESQPGMLTDADHAMKGIIDAAAAIGIDLGAEWGNQIDVSKK